jgi:hypothetical protein
VRKALLTIPRQAAGAASGWLNETVRDIAFSSDDGFQRIHHILQDIASGNISDRVADALGACVLVALDKGGGAVRPIAMSDCLRRAASRAVCIQLAERFQQHFAPLQYGVQAPGGAEQVKLQIDTMLAAHPDWCVLRVDARNAFNTVSRAAILGELARAFPELLPLAGQFYIRSGRLHFRGEDGRTVTLGSVTGAQQGDPLGPMLYALAIHPVLREVARRYRGVALVLGLLDDIHLVGPQRAVAAAFRMLRGLLRERGQQMSPGKCVVWAPCGDYSEFERGGVSFASDPDVTCAPDGFDVLGLPTGPADTLPARVLARCMDTQHRGRPNFAQKLHALRRLADTDALHGAAAALCLLRACALPTCTYMFRCLPPEVVSATAAAADAAVRALVAELTAPATETPAPIAVGSLQAAILTLPVGKGWGGIGLLSTQLVAPLAHVAAFVANAPTIVENYVRRAEGGPCRLVDELTAAFQDVYDAARPHEQ